MINDNMLSMKKQLYLFYLQVTFIFLSCFLNAQDGYQRPEHIEIEIWNAVEPKLIPFDHPVKKKLDKIFSKPHVNHDITTLHAAGFSFYEIRNPVHTIVAKHPKIKGHIIKLYTDIQLERDEWVYWLQRIQGAELIAEAIVNKGYENIFSVPKKWIYLLPNTNGDPERKNFILVAEKMYLIDYEENRLKWLNKLSHEWVYAIYDMLQTLGLYDSVYIDNLAFTKNKKLCFVDTEHYLKWPVPFQKLNRRFSNEMQVYWKELTQQ